MVEPGVVHEVTVPVTGDHDSQRDQPEVDTTGSDRLGQDDRFHIVGDRYLVDPRGPSGNGDSSHGVPVQVAARTEFQLAGDLRKSDKPPSASRGLPDAEVRGFREASCLPAAFAGVAGKPHPRPGTGACSEELPEAAGGVPRGLLERNGADLVEETVALGALQGCGGGLLSSTQAECATVLVGLLHDGDEVVADNTGTPEQPGQFLGLLAGGV